MLYKCVNVIYMYKGCICVQRLYIFTNFVYIYKGCIYILQAEAIDIWRAWEALNYKNLSSPRVGLNSDSQSVIKSLQKPGSI